MKRFLLFTGQSYYPSGGADDLQGAFVTMECAIEKAHEFNAQQLKTYHGYGMDHFRGWMDWWAHVYDLQQGKIVWTSAEERK